MTKALTILGFLILGFDAADLTITGIAVLALVILLVAAWLGGVFTADFWIAPDSARLGDVDQELDRLYPPVTARTVNHDYTTPGFTETRS